MSHTFHIPVLGLGFSVDTPLKVARYGINSVVSVVDDELIERMRLHHAQNNNIATEPIAKTEPDARAKRIKGYLNLLSDLVDEQFEKLKQQDFNAGTDLDRYFRLLPDDSPLKQGYELMTEYPDSPRKTLKRLKSIWPYCSKTSCRYLKVIFLPERILLSAGIC